MSTASKVLVTVFTPAYNRASTLLRTYESLCKQNCKDFIWLIIDDGSQDDTAELVQEWMKNDNGFEIRYIYKENGGMHTAHNVAYDNIDTELNVCIDSDDMLAENAINIIYNTWETIKEKDYAGIVGLDADYDGNVIGTPFDRDVTTLSGYYSRGGIGDKKLVYRTDLMKKYPAYPEFAGERLVPLGYKYLLCDQDYCLFAINEVLCNVEYQTNGSSKNMWKQRVLNANGFAFYKTVQIKYHSSIIQLIKDIIMYIGFSRIGKRRSIIKNSPKKALTLLLYPAGIVFAVITIKKSGLFS